MAYFSHTLDIGNGHYLRIDMSEVSQSITANTTRLQYDVLFFCGSQQYYHYYSNNFLTLSIGGTMLYNDAFIGSIVLEEGQWTNIASGQITVAHRADGVKDLHTYMRFRQPYGDPAYDASNSWWDSLTRINRGLVKISDGSSFSDHQTYIYDANGWSLYQPYIYNGSSWEMY